MLAPIRAPNEPEKTAIEAARARVRSRGCRLQLDLEQSESGDITRVGGGHSDHAGWLARLEDVFGTSGHAFAVAQLNTLIVASKRSDGVVDQTQLNAMVAIVEGTRPENEVQALLAVQMAATHAAAQTVLARALRVDQIPQFDSAAGMAIKLLRTFTMQAETLAKLQRGGEQVVKVVHVHPGAQAIVGNVVSGKTHQMDRGGDNFENADRPHAKRGLPA